MLHFISTIFLVLMAQDFPYIALHSVLPTSLFRGGGIFDFEKFKSLGKSFYSVYGGMFIWGTLRQ